MVKHRRINCSKAFLLYYLLVSCARSSSAYSPGAGFCDLLSSPNKDGPHVVNCENMRLPTSKMIATKRIAVRDIFIDSVGTNPFLHYNLQGHRKEQRVRISVLDRSELEKLSTLPPCKGL